MSISQKFLRFVIYDFFVIIYTTIVEVNDIKEHYKIPLYFVRMFISRVTIVGFRYKNI